MRPYKPLPSTALLDRFGAFVARFNGVVTRRSNAPRETEGTPVWQRNYYEHVVRDDEDVSRIRAYIEDNPRNWEDDEYYA